jgi:hypothetical protein
MLTSTTLDEETAGRDRTRRNDERNASPTAHIEGEELVDEVGVRKIEDCGWRIVCMRSIIQSV